MQEQTNGQQAAPGRPAYEVVRFETNLPQKVALAFETGLEVKGSKPGYGDQVLYTLVGNKRMYVHPIAAEQIAELGIQKGEEFLIGKKEIRDGQKRAVRWVVSRLEPETETPLAADIRASLPIAAAMRNGDPRSSIEIARAARQPVAAVPSPVAQRTVSTSAAPAPAPNIPSGLPREIPSDRTGTSNGTASPPTQIEAALKTAIAAAAGAESYAKSIQYTVRFTNEDIRALGITVLIGMQQRQQ